MCIPRSDCCLFRRTVVLPVNLPFGRALRDGLGADEDASSFPLTLISSSFLRAAAALTLCLAASISAKDNRRALEKQTVRIKLTRKVENPLTMERVFVQSASFKRRFWAPAVRMKSVKDD